MTLEASRGVTVGAVLTEVEKTLREIWLPTPGEPTKARACTMNLVVVGPEDIVDRYQAIVDEVTSSIPARAILLSLAPEGADGLSSDVSAVCGVGADATCSERIRLRASGAVCARAVSIVDAILVPELPTSLVWLGRVHVADPVFAGLAGDAARVVLDTEYTSLSSLLALARWARSRSSDRESSSGTPHIADLAWTRLGPWQEMIARFFDDPRLVAHANAIRKVELRQASEKGARFGPEPALLFGWLATRLGWRSEFVGGHLRLTSAAGQAIHLAVCGAPRAPGVAPAALTGVTIEAETGGILVRGSVEREDASPTAAASAADVLMWRLHAEGVPSPAGQHVRLGANKGARLLERTLHRASYDAALMESARFAEEIEEEGLSCS